MTHHTYEHHSDQTPKDLESSLRLTHLLYGLQAVCFILGVTYLIAVIVLIINYVKLPDVKGTWLESHYRWQIRTFWFGLLWAVVGAITIVVLVGWAILLANYIWLIYRVIKGWIYLNDKKTLYLQDFSKFGLG